MAATGFTPIQLYRTTTASAVPVDTNLADGELAINTTDEKLYFKNAAGTVKLLASTSGASGDVVGPGSATDSALAAFDGTTGKLIKNVNLTANNVLLGNGTGAPQVVAPGTTGNVLTSNGTTWQSSAPAAQAYPAAGMAVSTGTAWGTSKTTPTGDVVGTTDTQTLTNKTITNLVFDGDYTEEVFTITDGASVDLDPSNGTVQLWTLGASRSPTDTGFASGQSMTLMIEDGSAYAITWPSVTWKTDGGTAPVLNTTGYTVVQLWKVSTVLYGARVGDA
jgi:hypothetical protein